jgi:hypothetical protein
VPAHHPRPQTLDGRRDRRVLSGDAGAAAREQLRMEVVEGSVRDVAGPGVAGVGQVDHLLRERRVNRVG